MKHIFNWECFCYDCKNHDKNMKESIWNEEFKRVSLIYEKLNNKSDPDNK